MIPLDDGGPAFPQVNPNFDGNWDRESQRGGMSLRDWFAGQALANSNIEEHNGAQWADRVAEQAYRIADAMLAARGGKEGA